MSGELEKEEEATKPKLILRLSIEKEWNDVSSNPFLLCLLLEFMITFTYTVFATLIRIGWLKHQGSWNDEVYIDMSAMVGISFSLGLVSGSFMSRIPLPSITRKK
jgi:hypothetical protein